MSAKQTDAGFDAAILGARDKARAERLQQIKAKEAAQIKAVHPFRSVRRAGVPLSFFESADPAATVRGCVLSMNERANEVPCLVWDCVRGVTAAMVDGIDRAPALGWIATVPDDVKLSWANPGVILPYLAEHPPIAGEGEDRKPGVVFLHNTPRFWDDISIAQALWNCRDALKSVGVSLVMLGCGGKVPAELKNDVPIFSEPVPDQEAIKRIVSNVCGDAGLEAGTVDQGKAVDGLLGYLSDFGVEQSLALSLVDDGKRITGIDYDRLWNLKVAALRNQAGLEVSLPKIKFSDLVGCEGYKSLVGRYLKGRKAPRCVFWLDEIEKMLSGGQGDLSGTSQAMIEQLLFWTQAREVDGVLLLGIPGAGKSLSVQCTAGEAAVPLLRGSLSTVKGSLVGQSEQQMKSMLASVDAVAQGRCLMVATCNSLDALTPEVMARFRLAIFFYDYPDQTERDACWKYYVRRFGLSAGPVPPSKNWVGREIASCCERANILEITLAEAAQTVVPVSIANAAKMDALRKGVSGRFLSAARPGVFTVETSAEVGGGRKFGV